MQASFIPRYRNFLSCLYAFQIPGFKELLESYRKSGRKLFIATNSLWDYTYVVMNYLISNKVGDDMDMEWLRLFDVVMTGKVLLFGYVHVHMYV